MGLAQACSGHINATNNGWGRVTVRGRRGRISTTRIDGGMALTHYGLGTKARCLIMSLAVWA